MDAALAARIDFADAVQSTTDREYANVKPTARKTGRNPEFPFVPVLAYSTGGIRDTGRTEQILGLAFATRAAAVGAAKKALWDRRVAFTRKLSDPTHRALRESRGLPREVPSR